MFPSYLKNPLAWPFLIPLIPAGVACLVVDRIATSIRYR